MIGLTCLVLVTAAIPSFALWPMPANLTQGGMALKLAASFSIQLSGSLATTAPPDLKDAVARTITQLRTDNMQRLVVGGGAMDSSQIEHASSLRALTLSLTSNSVLSIAQNVQLPLASRVESYSLHVPFDGSAAILSADTTLGLFRGLTTFAQFWYTYQGTIYTLSAPVSIFDTPAYPYRGFMLDTARNYFPVSDILRTLDGLSYVKANTFHWHIVDSQSFPLVVSGFPELSAKGAYSSSQVYTPSDVAHIVSYAGERGIDVLLEIDTPGHTAAIAAAHPKYIACFDASPWADFANEPPSGQLRLAAPAVHNFTSELFKSVLASLPGQYFSTGGDEINANCYAQDNETQTELSLQGKTFEEALSDFVVNVHATVKNMGKTPVVWQELVLSHNVTLSNDTVVMVWVSSEDAMAVVEKGFSIIHAPSDYFYLDCGAGGWLGDDVNGNSWCDPFKSWQKAYSFNPLANISSEKADLVLGGEQLLWTEQSSPENLEPIVWPRAASSAEVFWTGATLSGGNETSTSEALARMHDMRYRFVRRGIKANALQPHWCAIRPHMCDLTA